MQTGEELYALLGATLPAHLKLADYGKQIGIKL